VLRFIAERYADRHLDIEVAQLMLAFAIARTQTQTYLSDREPRAIPPPAPGNTGGGFS